MDLLEKLRSMDIEERRALLKAFATRYGLTYETVRKWPRKGIPEKWIGPLSEMFEEFQASGRVEVRIEPEPEPEPETGTVEIGKGGKSIKVLCGGNEYIVRCDTVDELIEALNKIAELNNIATYVPMTPAGGIMSFEEAFNRDVIQIGKYTEAA